MMRAIAIVVLALLVTAVAAPRPARASDLTQPLIISGAIAGAVALVSIIAILGASNDPEFLQLAPVRPKEAEAPVRFGPRCQPVGGNVTLACW